MRFHMNQRSDASSPSILLDYGREVIHGQAVFLKRRNYLNRKDAET